MSISLFGRTLSRLHLSQGALTTLRHHATEHNNNNQADVAGADHEEAVETGPRRPFQGVNKVILLGTVGDKPKLMKFSEEAQMATFSLATNAVFKDDKGESKSLVEWHSVVVRGKGTAEFAEKFLSKGTRVYVEGSLKTRVFVDPQGVQRRQTQVVVPQRGGQLQVVRVAATREEPEKRDEDLF